MFPYNRAGQPELARRLPLHQPVHEFAVYRKGRTQLADFFQQLIIDFGMLHWPGWRPVRTVGSVQSAGASHYLSIVKSVQPDLNR